MNRLSDLLFVSAAIGNVVYLFIMICRKYGLFKFKKEKGITVFDITLRVLITTLCISVIYIDTQFKGCYEVLKTILIIAMILLILISDYLSKRKISKRGES